MKISGSSRLTVRNRRFLRKFTPASLTINDQPMDTRPPKPVDYTADSRSTNHDAIFSPAPSVESPKNTPELDPSSEEEPVQPAEEPLQLTPDHDKNVSTNPQHTPLTPKARPETVHLDHRPTSSTPDTSHHTHNLQSKLTEGRWDYINRFLQIGLETGNKKPFWKYLRVQKQEDFGISALKSNGTLFTDRKPISEILNTQFKSVFTKKTSSKIPQMPGTSFPSINALNITEFGVFKLLDKIDVSKASGPDCIPGRILQNLARELAPVLHYIFDQSLNSGDLPADWTLANVAPIFKKGSKLQAVNYRPVSLTCISCKLFEHIVCKHILGHLEEHGILTDLQHGFRTGRSCETQLITTFQDIASAYNKKGSQIDIAILDFSKAFDTVPHDGLLSKLKHYGIDDKIWTWISNFLKQRKQRVVVDGIQSDLVTVDSGVPQGTVLGPILFLNNSLSLWPSPSGRFLHLLYVGASLDKFLRLLYAPPHSG